MSPTSNSSGFTIMELMTVLAIITILLGIGISFYATMGAERRFEGQSASVYNLLSLARAVSQTSNSPVVVQIDPYEGEAKILRETTVALFRFEDGESGTVLGTGSLEGAVRNARSVLGRIGMGLEFGTKEGLKCSESYVEVEPNYLLSPPGGLVIEAWIYPGDFKGDKFRQLVGKSEEKEKRDNNKKKEPFKERYIKELRFFIVELYGSYYLRLTESYALEFAILPETSVFPFRTRNGVVQPNSWNHISVRYQKDDLRISVNGVEVSVFWVSDNYEMIPLYKMTKKQREEAMPERIPSIPSDSGTKFYISAPGDSFYGIIDEVRIGAIAAVEEVSLPSNFHFVGTRTSIHFNAKGELDSYYHTSEVVVLMTDKFGYVPPPEEKYGFSEGGSLNAPPTFEEAEKIRIKEGSNEEAERDARVAVLRVSLSGEASLSFTRWVEYFGGKEDGE
ncbi:MAG: LamG domain-containing protein [Planctomycetota bacterium]|nr:LamG domain-containing protein [Planctomycetota bacterium]